MGDLTLQWYPGQTLKQSLAVEISGHHYEILKSNYTSACTLFPFLAISASALK